MSVIALSRMTSRYSLRSEHAQALLELVLVLGLLEWSLWTNHKRVFSPPIRSASTAILAAAIVLVLSRQYRSNPREFRKLVTPVHWRSGLGSLALFTAAIVSLTALAGWQRGTIGNVENLSHWIARNWHLELVQQILLQLVLAPRIELLIGRGDTAGFVSAAIFALLHAPNPVLLILTFPAAIIWRKWFAAHRNLAAVTLSHLILAVAVLYCLNDRTLGNLRVGIGYVLRR